MRSNRDVVAWLPSQESNLPQRCLTGSRVRLARLRGMKWWSTSDSNRARSPCKGGPRTLRVPRSCAPRARKLALGVGFEPTSPRLQRGAFTRSAFRAFRGASLQRGTFRHAAAKNGGGLRVRTSVLAGPLGFRDRLPATPAAPSDRSAAGRRRIASRNWSARQDSNLLSPAPEAGALAG